MVQHRWLNASTHNRARMRYRCGMVLRPAEPGSAASWRRTIDMQPPRVCRDPRWTAHTFTATIPSRDGVLVGLLAISAVLGEIVVHIHTDEGDPIPRTTARETCHRAIATLWGTDASRAIAWEWSRYDRPTGDTRINVYTSWGRV